MEIVGIINVGALMQGNSVAGAINNSGAVVGYNHGDYAGAHHDYAFLYQNGVLTMLPPPETTGDSIAGGINDSGVIIGTANFGSMQTGAIYWINSIAAAITNFKHGEQVKQNAGANMLEWLVR